MPADPAFAARLRAYALMEESQGDAPTLALRGLCELEVEARAAGWAEVEFLSRAGQALYALVHDTDGGHVRALMEELVIRAEALDAPALTALALALHSVTAGVRGDSAALLTDAGRAVALVDDDRLIPEDRCTVLVVCAAAYNSLGLWELVDELYDAASELAPACEVAVQEAAVGVNRILIRLEWATALFQLGQERNALDQLARADEAVRIALATPRIPPLWQLDVAAAQDLLAFVRHAYGEVDPTTAAFEVDASLAGLAEHRRVLTRASDVEVLPLLGGFIALGLHRMGRRAEALATVRSTDPRASTSSGSRSFLAWVRATVLAGDERDEALAAHQEYGLLMARSRWSAREGALGAARSKIIGERLRVEHARLSRDVLLDPLTGLSNRRGFDEWLARPPRRPCFAALILIDLDEFKAVNDLCGHGAGDEVLRRIARLLTSHVRAEDMALRLGGDEFAIVMTDHHDGVHGSGHHGLEALETMAVQRARELGQAIADTDWSPLVGGLPVRASLGVAAGVLGPEHPDGAEGLYAQADIRLYEAKAGPHDVLFR